MGQAVSFQKVLRRLAIIDESFAEDKARLQLDLPRSGLLDPRAAALVRVGALADWSATTGTGCRMGPGPQAAAEPAAAGDGPGLEALAGDVTPPRVRPA